MITIPTIKATRLQFQGFGEKAACNLSPEHNTVVWEDSEFPCLQQLSDPICMEESVSLGILHFNIGAKITQGATNGY